jgi:hypothetical protein
MNIPSYIKPKPLIFKVILFLRYNVANCIYPFIFTPRAIYNNLVSENQNPYYLALIIHEEVHYKKQKELGILIFGLKYIFSKEFRLKEELNAIKASIKYLKSNNILLDLEKVDLSSSDYLFLWPISKYYKIEDIKKFYQEIK